MSLESKSFAAPRNYDYHLARGAADQRPILYLHGMGESGALFFEQHQDLIEKSGRTWILPNGPHPWERRRHGRIGYSWYFFLGDQEILRQSMGEAIDYLKSLLAHVSAKENVTLPVSVLGFSQGGYLGSVFAADDASLVTAMACAGGRLKHEFFAKRASYPPMLQLHGEEDYSVGLDLAKEALAEAERIGVATSLQTFAGVGHEISTDMLKAFLDWEQQQ